MEPNASGQYVLLVGRWTSSDLAGPRPYDKTSATVLDW